MSKRWVLCVAAGLGLAGGVAIGQMAAGQKSGGAPPPPTDQITPKARGALMRCAKGGKLEIERQNEGAATLFKGEWKHLTRESSATVTADGDLVSMNEGLQDKEVPASIKEVAAQQFPPGTKLLFVRKTTMVYEAIGGADGKAQAVAISPTGKVGEKKDVTGGEAEGFGAGGAAPVQPLPAGPGPLKRGLPARPDPTKPNPAYPPRR
jgi:hypothetical protein